MTPKCRVCDRQLGSSAVRYQMTRRAPQDLNAVKMWWLCASHIADVENAIDTIADLFFGPTTELQKVGVY